MRIQYFPSPLPRSETLELRSDARRASSQSFSPLRCLSALFHGALLLSPVGAFVGAGALQMLPNGPFAALRDVPAARPHMRRSSTRHLAGEPRKAKGEKRHQAAKRAVAQPQGTLYPRLDVPTSLPPLPTLRVEDGRFVDSQGRIVLLRGVNMACDSKVPPFFSVQDTKELAFLARAGINAMRLLFIWEAFEPQRGAYRASYLEYQRSIIRAAQARGIYTVLDFHQDRLARALADGCGEGWPQFTIPKDIPRATPDNGAACIDWKHIDAPDVNRTWQAFYADRNKIRTAYIKMVGRVAAELKHESGLIGYDLLNEPWGDDHDQLAPLYADLASVIRRSHPSAVIFIEPHFSPAWGDGEPTRLPGGNVAYAPHFYGRPAAIPTALSRMQQTAASIQAALFIGEYGTQGANGSAYIAAVRSAFDRDFISASQWCYTARWTELDKDGWNREDYSIVDKSGQPRANFAPRAYAQKVAGIPLTQTLTETPKGQVLRVQWKHDPKRGQTEIFVPAYGHEDLQPQATITASDDVHCHPANVNYFACSSPTVGEKYASVTFTP